MGGLFLRRETVQGTNRFHRTLSNASIGADTNGLDHRIHTGLSLIVSSVPNLPENERTRRDSLHWMWESHGVSSSMSRANVCSDEWMLDLQVRNWLSEWRSAYIWESVGFRQHCETLYLLWHCFHQSQQLLWALLSPLSPDMRIVLTSRRLRSPWGLTITPYRTRPCLRELQPLPSLSSRQKQGTFCPTTTQSIHSTGH